MPGPGVFFDPPLWLQRQGWIIGQLRNTKADSVLDIGCGEAKLLSHLLNPAFQLDEFPLERFPRLWAPSTGDDNPSASTSRSPEASSSSNHQPLLPPSHWTHSPPDIVLERLAGLDYDGSVLDSAKATLEKHMQRSQATHGSSEPRWVPLTSELYQGRFEAYDARLEGFDVVVASEVIEHLEEQSVQAFAPMLLGVYQPRILLVTTPNYGFNVRFNEAFQESVADAPRQDDASTPRLGYPDPTGRTKRRFRHDDHQFEWTVEEFTAYCEEAARDYGYDVEIGGVGEAAGVGASSQVDDKLRFCTQTAIFRRQDTGAPSAFTSRRPSAHTVEEVAHRFLMMSSPRDRLLSADTSAGTSVSSEMSVEERRSRLARSRMPSHLPWLSTPTTSPDAARSKSREGPAAAAIASASQSLTRSAVQIVGKVPVVAEPDDVPEIPTGLGLHEGARGRAAASAATIEPDHDEESKPHTLFWSHFSPAYRHGRERRAGSTVRGGSAGGGDGRTQSSRSRSRRPTQPLPGDAVMSKALDRLYHVAEIGDKAKSEAAAPGAGSSTTTRPEAGARLWDIWIDDSVRAACGGRCVVLLDALRLVMPSEAEVLEYERTQAGGSRPADILVGSDGREWELRVVHDEAGGAADLWLFFSGSEVREWSSGDEAAAAASGPVAGLASAMEASHVTLTPERRVTGLPAPQLASANDAWE